MQRNSGADPSRQALVTILIGCVGCLAIAGGLDLLALMFGFPPVSLIIFLGSIICTMGISFIFWVPVFWLLGKIYLTLRQGFGSQSGGTYARSQGASSLHGMENLALLDYILKSRQRGASDTQIVHRLREKGWGEAEIEQVMQQINQQTNPG